MRIFLSEIINKTVSNENHRGVMFPAIGEEVVFNTPGDTQNKLKGQFVGFIKIENHYSMIIGTKEGQNNRQIPINTIIGMSSETGSYLANSTDEHQLILLYEHHDIVYRAPLYILKHINSLKTNNKYVLGSFGLAIDLAIFAIAAASTSSGYSGFNQGHFSE